MRDALRGAPDRRRPLRAACALLARAHLGEDVSAAAEDLVAALEPEVHGDRERGSHPRGVRKRRRGCRGGVGRRGRRRRLGGAASRRRAVAVHAGRLGAGGAMLAARPRAPSRAVGAPCGAGGLIHRARGGRRLRHALQVDREALTRTRTITCSRRRPRSRPAYRAPSRSSREEPCRSSGTCSPVGGSRRRRCRRRPRRRAPCTLQP